jgi:hypothetical protein
MSDSHTDLLSGTLEIAAERAGDVVGVVFDAFFSRSAAGFELMAHSDGPMRGRMFEGTIDLLLSEAAMAPDGYLDWELGNHLVAYGVTAAMYADYLAAVRETIQAACGADWGPPQSAAWDAKLGAIMDRVEAFEADR